jgi:hypothetical protein
MLLYVAAQLCEFYNINQGATQSNTVMEGFSIAFLILFYASCMALVVMWAVRKRKRLWALYAGDVAATPQQAKKGATASSVKTAKSAIKAIPEEFYELGILVLSLLGCIAGHIVDGQHSWNGSTEWGVVSSEIKAGYVRSRRFHTSFVERQLTRDLRVPSSPQFNIQHIKTRYTYLAFIFTAFMSALLGRHARIAVIIEKDNTLEAKKVGMGTDTNPTVGKTDAVGFPTPIPTPTVGVGKSTNGRGREPTISSVPDASDATYRR